MATAADWVYRYTLFGKARWMGLGAFADVSLAEAREAATAARKQVRAGNDPIAARKAEMDAKRSALSLHTFKEVAAAYVAAHEASWRNEKHRQQWRNTLATYADPVLGKMPVAVVDVAASRASASDTSAKAPRPIQRALPNRV
jgi:hypothetical protein